MTELPIVVNMTVDASRTEYDLTAESNLEEIELLNDTVIETGGSHVPVYEGPYTVDAGLNAVTLDTDGKRMTQDVTVNALTENQVTGNSLTINTSTGKVSSLVSISRGYSPSLFGVSKTLQLSTQAGTTITPSTSEQVAVARGKYTTGVVKVRAIPTGTRGTPTATKGTVSNHSVSVTPSVTNTTGYITGGTVNGTAVSVSASELVSGSLSITTNNTYDVTNYASVDVNVSSGTTDYYATSGACYVPNMVMPKMVQGLNGLYKDATEMVSLVCNDTRKIGGYGSAITEVFYGCTKLETISMPYIQGIASSYADRVFGNCTKLSNAVFGSVGYPISDFSNSGAQYQAFRYCTQNNFTITLYVDAVDLASIPAAVTGKAPWGATNATIVYRNSTTGEVITA